MLLNSQSAVEYLEEELLRRTRANSRYSLRSYARDLGLSPGELSEILRKKRKLSLKVAAKVSEVLGFNPEEERFFFRLVRASGPEVAEAPIRSETLTLDLFRVVSDWYCFAILNLAETKTFRWDPVFIGKRLGISQQEARDAVQRLERVGLIERSGPDFQVVKDFVFTSEGIPSEAIRHYHKTLLDKAKTAVDVQPVYERYFSGLGLSVDSIDLKALHKDFGVFLQQMAKKYGNRKGSETYQLELAFFRLTEKE
jgi:uncharacterized protein (TIGR02147 family)